MNPAIVYPDGKPDESYLIDLHSTAFTPHVQGVELPTGKVAQVALKAVAIKHLRAGEMANIDGVIYPAPCQVVATSKWTLVDPMSRGIFHDAAVALLTMNHGMKNAVSPSANFKMGQDAKGFNRWSFATAWGWSAWQDLHRRSGNRDWPLERRWESLKAIGYADDFAAFRKVCSRLKLSVTKSRPI